MNQETIKSILSWLEGREHQHTDSEGQTSYNVILPASLLEELTQHLKELLSIPYTPEGRREALETLIMGVMRYHLPGFTHGSPMHTRTKEHIPWLIEEGFLTEGEDGCIWFFNRERVRHYLDARVPEEAKPKP